MPPWKNSECGWPTLDCKCDLESRATEKPLRRARFNRCFLALPARNSEAIEDLARRVGLIERVEVNSADVVVQQVVTLLEREVHPDALDHLPIVAATLHRTEQLRRKPRSPGQLGDPFEATD